MTGSGTTGPGPVSVGWYARNSGVVNGSTPRGAACRAAVTFVANGGTVTRATAGLLIWVSSCRPGPSQISESIPPGGVLAVPTATVTGGWYT